jgi:pimeloyl-ACP methyl ester carboxylesterase
MNSFNVCNLKIQLEPKGDDSVNKKILKTAVIILVVLVVLVIITVAIGPFLIPARPLEGLGATQDLAAPESQFITIPFDGTDGIEIHYLSNGANTSDDGPTFILLHGSNFNAFTWNEVLDLFGQYGQVFAYDQIPYGLSEKLVAGDWEESNPYTSEAAVEQLFLFMDALAIERAVLVGSSYGAALAVQATLVHPERVDALILADAAVYVEEEMPAWLFELPQVRHLGPVLARQLGQSEAFIRQTYRDPEQISAERMALTLLQTQVTNWDMAYWEYLCVWGSDTPNYQARIPEIQQPTLVISGDSDNVVPVADSQKLHSELPNSELAVLSACGHVPQEECPELFEDAVTAWLSNLE